MAKDRKHFCRPSAEIAPRNHYYAITDQFIEFFASRMEANDRTESRQKILTSVQKRIALRSGAQPDEHEKEETAKSKGN